MKFELNEAKNEKPTYPYLGIYKKDKTNHWFVTIFISRNYGFCIAASQDCLYSIGDVVNREEIYEPFNGKITLENS